MNPLPLETIKAALIAALIGAGLGFFYLWTNEVEEFAKYKATVEAASEANRLHVENLKADFDQATKETEEQHEQNIADLRDFYDRRMRSKAPGGPGQMPGISKPPVSIDAIPSDALPLAGQCAETTLQLIDLQGWITKITEASKE